MDRSKLSIVVLVVGLLFAVSSFAVGHDRSAVGKFAPVKKLPVRAGRMMPWQGKIVNSYIPDQVQDWMTKHPRAIGWVPFKVTRANVICYDVNCRSPKEMEIITANNIRLLLVGPNYVKRYLAKNPQVMADTRPAFPAKVDSMHRKEFVHEINLGKIFVHTNNGKITKVALPTMRRRCRK